MSTRGTVFVAVNGVSAGVTEAGDARNAILEHIRELVLPLAQDASVARLEELSARYGMGFEVKSGRISNVTFC